MVVTAPAGDRCYKDHSFFDIELTRPTSLEAALKRFAMIALTATAITAGSVRAVRGAESGVLDATLQGKALVAQIHADWCPVCRAEKPTVDAVRAKYGKEISYVAFDVTNGRTASAAAEQAKQLGLSA